MGEARQRNYTLDLALLVASSHVRDYAGLLELEREFPPEVSIFACVSVAFVLRLSFYPLESAEHPDSQKKNQRECAQHSLASF